MKVKLTFDNTVPVDEIPDPIVAEADELEDAFTELCEELDAMPSDFPVESVRILGKNGRDVTDEFNEFWEEY